MKPRPDALAKLPTERDRALAAECFGGIWTECSMLACLEQVKDNIASALADERYRVLRRPTGRARGRAEK